MIIFSPIFFFSFQFWVCVFSFPKVLLCSLNKTKKKTNREKERGITKSVGVGGCLLRFSFEYFFFLLFSNGIALLLLTRDFSSSFFLPLIDKENKNSHSNGCVCVCEGERVCMRTNERDTSMHVHTHYAKRSHSFIF